MLNHVTLVGRIKLIDLKNNSLVINLSEDTDVGCIFKDNMKEQVDKYLNVDSVIGVKGSLVNNCGNLIVQIEKMSFLSSEIR